MSSEPFPPPSDADPAGGTARIAPVTSEMMDHAARSAAEQADAVAHEDPATPPDPPSEPPRAPDPAPVAPAPASATGHAPVTDGIAAGAAPEDAAASGSLQAADLAFTHGGTAAESTPGGAARAAAGSFDGFGRLNAKILEIAAANVSAAGAFVSALLAAKSVPEAAAINADHMRRRLDALTTQGREVVLLAQKAVFDAMRPPSDDASRKP